MSNFQAKYINWQKKMSARSENEKHNYALTVSLFISAIVFFFIASGWYFRISGDSFDTSLFTDLEGIYNNSKTIYKGNN
jgi:hypothetical protein